ncbi:MAG: PQQ-dependent sugar dehydrogenase, partial [Flavobacteriaceae bacterium]
VTDPHFQTNHHIYVSYVAKGAGGTTTKVIRAQLEQDSLINIKTLLVALPFTEGLFHYGGGMTFGPDKKLYVTVGERIFNESDEPDPPIAQDIKDRRGKIYRLNKDGSIPSDNPDFGPDAVPGIYASGIRAAQGITLNSATGQIWFSEHGTRQGDEINLLKAGANYGWPIITTGKYRSLDYTPPDTKNTEFTDPRWYWLQTVAPTGLNFYWGDEFPEWKGNLLVPGLSRGSLWRLRIENDTVKSLEELFVDARERARKVIQSPGGKLYLLTEDLKDRKNGKIIRIKNSAK